MYKAAIFLLTILLSSVVSSQNIYTALHLNQDEDYKTKRPKQITETNTFYNSSGKEIQKSVKIFDEAGMLLTEVRYDDKGAMKARLMYTNDTVNRLTLSRVFERWTGAGYKLETAVYKYDDKNFHVGTTDKDGNGMIYQRTDLICNDKGHPVELSLFDARGNLYGTETAKYIYDSNKVITSVVSADGKVLSSSDMKISYRNAYLFPGTEVYNAMGDVTSWSRKNLDGSETLFEEEYTYDSFGNCVENKIYEVKVKANGKKKRELDRVFKKEYIY
jgi:hypothetical protein